MSKEKLEQWRSNIAFELRDYSNYWKINRESMADLLEADFLEYKRDFEKTMQLPTTPYKKELKERSLAIIEYGEAFSTTKEILCINVRF
ncbi:8359_t:CDS:2 [Entrophospora sp. SA101]|nr:8359_t:CDS:2 [Entrophospora sp. SA101]